MITFCCAAEARAGRRESLTSNSINFEPAAAARAIKQVYVAPWSGYEDTTLTLYKSGEYLYEHWSDAGGPQPERTGSYSDNYSTLTLANNDHRPEWRHERIDGVEVLMTPNVWELWRKKGTIHRFGVLIPRPAATIESDGRIFAPWQKR